VRGGDRVLGRREKKGGCGDRRFEKEWDGPDRYSEVSKDAREPGPRRDLGKFLARKAQAVGVALDREKSPVQLYPWGGRIGGEKNTGLVVLPRKPKKNGFILEINAFIKKGKLKKGQRRGQLSESIPWLDTWLKNLISQAGPKSREGKEMDGGKMLGASHVG